MVLTAFLVALFLIHVNRSRVYNVPKYVKQHYGTHTLKLLRKLEKRNKQLTKHLCDVEFLKTCHAYKLHPKMTNFKLYKNDTYLSRIKQGVKMKLLLTEIGFQNRQITKLRKEIASLENNLFSVVTYFMKIKIVAFIKHMCVVHHETVGNIHNRKLENLGLHIGSNTTNTSAICNMTNLALTK